MTNTSLLSNTTTKTSLVDDVVATSGSSTDNVVYQSHLYYLHPSNYPRMDLVSIVFMGRNMDDGEK